MDYWVPGQADKDASHPECAASAAVDEAFWKVLGDKIISKGRLIKQHKGD